MSDYSAFDEIEQGLREAFAGAKKYTDLPHGERDAQATNRLAMAEIAKTLLMLEQHRAALAMKENVKRPRASRPLGRG